MGALSGGCCVKFVMVLVVALCLAMVLIVGLAVAFVFAVLFVVELVVLLCFMSGDLKACSACFEFIT